MSLDAGGVGVILGCDLCLKRFQRWRKVRGVFGGNWAGRCESRKNWLIGGKSEALMAKMKKGHLFPKAHQRQTQG